MFTEWDKAIAAFVTPILSILALTNILPADTATALVPTLTAVITAAATFFVPNKA